MVKATSTASGVAGGIASAARASMLIALSVAPAQAQGALAAPTGDAVRGKALYDTTLRCYACHGFDGQTGSPRLVPAARPEEAFVAYVRTPPAPGMPSFAAAPERDLKDVYAYVRSIPVAAPPVESIPILKAIRDRRMQAP